MAAPAVRAMKWAAPDARLSVLAPEGLADFWNSIDEVDGVIERARDEPPKSVAGKLRDWDFDLGVLLTNSFRTAWEMRLAGIPKRVGFRGHGRRLLLTDVVADPPQAGVVEHQGLTYLRLVEAMGAAEDVLERAREERLSLSGRRPQVPRRERIRLGICAGAQYGPAKQWPLQRFAATAEKVRMRLDCEWVLFGGPNEVEDGRMLQGMTGGSCVNLVGGTTMAQLMPRLRECQLLLTNDTGTMHLADFLGVPTVAIFGSTDPVKTGPSGKGHRIMRHHVECSPCFLRECPIDFRCMHGVEVDDVVEVVIEAARG